MIEKIQTVRKEVWRKRRFRNRVKKRRRKEGRGSSEVTTKTNKTKKTKKTKKAKKKVIFPSEKMIYSLIPNIRKLKN